MSFAPSRPQFICDGSRSYITLHQLEGVVGTTGGSTAMPPLESSTASLVSPVAFAVDGPGLFGAAEGVRITGSATVAAVRGTASFTDITIDKACAGYRLQFVAPGSPSGGSGVVSDPLPVSEGPPSRLRIAVQPGKGSVNGTLRIQPVIELVDAGGNRVFNHSIYVEATLRTNPSGANLTVAGEDSGGTTKVLMRQGVATFVGLGLSLPGRGYTFTFAAPMLELGAASGPLARVGVESAPFGVCGTPARIEVISRSLVRVRDAWGTPVRGAVGNVEASIRTDPGCPHSCSALAGTTSRAVAGNDGLVDFSDLVVNPPPNLVTRYVPEIQKLFVHCAAGAGATLGGQFQLTLELATGKAYTTSSIGHDAPAMIADEVLAGERGSSLQAKLQTLVPLGTVSVVRAARSPDEVGAESCGWTWTVTFGGMSGAAPLLRVERHLNRLVGTGAGVYIERAQLGVAFALEYKYGSGAAIVSSSSEGFRA